MSKLDRIIWNVWVTSRCNLDCKYCYITEAKRDASFDQARIPRLIDFILEYSMNYDQMIINFMGGEPLLEYPIIREIADSLQERWYGKLQFSLTTNGILVNDEMVTFFKEHGFAISLSWDGCKEINDLYRIDRNGNGTYYKILNTYNEFRDRGFANIRIRSTFNSKSIKYLKDSVKDFIHIDKNINVIFIPDYFDDGWNSENLSELNIISNEVNKNAGNRISIIGRSNLIKSSCSGGIYSFHIYCNGKIYPCSYVVGKMEYIIGDLENGFEEAKIHELSEMYSLHINECNGCDYEKYCLTYKCRYLNLVLSGDMNTPSPIVCSLENIKMCNSVMLKGKEK
ncbi:MAG: radical SAM protein [Lachnospiraceae bacterium]|nr:radical SAM protein [Lachnospiraceae bacterium]